MAKAEVKERYWNAHENMMQFLKQHEDTLWDQGPANKWTTAQHVLHLVQSSKALNSGLKAPKLALRWKFGVANRPSRTFEETKNKYHTKLAAAGNVVSPFSQNMPDLAIDTKTALVGKFEKHSLKSLEYLDRTSEKALDKYILPHPLLGKMTLREMFDWCAVHVDHHRVILEEKYC